MKPESATDPTTVASVWLTRLHEGRLSSRESAEFADWLRDSPLHVHEFLECLAVWESLGHVHIELDDRSLAAIGNVVDIDRARTGGAGSMTVRHNASRRRFGVAAVAAAVAVGMIGAWLVIGTPASNPTADVLTTDIGEQRSVTLPDGSLITLNTQSTVRVDIQRGERNVELLSGEVLFGVVADPSRPFVVTVDDTQITVVGTEFNVRRHDDRVLVTVIEGSVRVAQPYLGAGGVPREELLLTGGQQSAVSDVGFSVMAVEVADVVAWKERKLVFDRTRLADIADEFNRYNRKQLIIDGEALGNKRFSGMFFSNDLDSFLKALEVIESIHIETNSDGTRVIVRITDRSFETP